MTNETRTITLPIRGDGSALKLVEGVGVLSLVGVKMTSPTPQPGTKISWVPDPDNEMEHTIFWVTDAVPWTPAPASGEITLELTYAPE